MRLRTAPLVLALAAIVPLAFGDAPAMPIRAEVYVRGERRDTRVAGDVTAYDDDGLIMTTPAGERSIAWDELTTSSAFTLKSRLIDKLDASDWIGLGQWGWDRGLDQQARAAFGQARKIDGATAGEIDAILATPAGSLRPQPLGTGRAVEPASQPSEPTVAVVATTGPADADAPPTMQPGYEAGQTITQYTTPTEAEHAASIARTRSLNKQVETKLNLSMAELETAHFLIYTDWDPQEHPFLKDKLEGAYRVVARQFNRATSDTVFVGKLPVFMFAKQGDFVRFARVIDQANLPPTVLGYFISDNELGHMAMWKPAIGQGIGAGANLQDAQRKWARTLVHEFCHAFIHRYQSDARVPRWLNEGVAELIAEGELPTNNYHGRARMAAMENAEVAPLFDDSNMPSGYYYPVMMTLAEVLVKQDRVAFIAMFTDIKGGMDPEAALTKNFRVDYAKLETIWRAYARGLK